MKVKYIIFDFDGTLADSRAIFVTVFNRLAKKHNYKTMEPEVMEHLQSLSIIDRCRYLNVPLYKIPFLAAEFLSLYKIETAQINLYEGIKHLLDELHTQGYHLSMISSNDTHVITSFLADHDINVFDEIQSSRNIFGKDKVIQSFLRKRGIVPSSALYVGDELRDIEACQKARIKIIWVSWGYDNASLVTQKKPDFTATQPNEILSIIEKINTQ